MSDIRLEGLNETIRGLNKLKNVKGYTDALRKACALVERSAKENAPKGNGELRRSISSKVENQGEELVGIVYTPLLYAPYVEFGTGLFAEEEGRQDVPWCYQDDKGEWHTTSGMKPHPFMRPALNDNKGKILLLLREGAKQ